MDRLHSLGALFHSVMADDTSPSSPTGHITIPTTKNNNNTHGQDPQAMTPNAKRRLGLFPRSNSQKLLQKPTQRRWHTNRNTNTSNSKLAEQQQHQEEDEEGQATDDFPFDPTRLVVRLSLSGARHLASSDDIVVNPYAIVSCAGQRERTHAIKQTSDPEWATTFDFPLDTILGHRRKQMALTQGITLTVCSKDRFKSVFLGQYRLSLQDLTAYQQSANKIKWYPIQTTPRHRRRFRLRRKAKPTTTSSITATAPNSQNSTDTELGGGDGGYESSGGGGSGGLTGEISFKVGLLAKSVQGSSMDDSISLSAIEQTWEMLWHQLTAVSASSSSETGIAGAGAGALPLEEMEQLQLNPASLLLSDDESHSESSDRGGTPRIGDNEQPKRRFMRKKATTVAETTTKPDGGPKKRRLRRFRRRQRRQRRPAEHIAQFRSDVVGIMFMEICHANDLPPEKNVTRTSFDMDPFVIVTFGTSTFRTRSIRHNLNPVWNEKLFFHVRHHESRYKLKFAIYDKDKFSGNDFVAWQDVPIIDIIEQSKDKRLQHQQTITPDAIDTDMDRNTIALTMVKQDKWQDKHQPTLTLRAKFVPYVEIRKMFWLALAKTYDIDENGTMSKLEVQAMLESLGSTITEATLDDFWRQHGKDPTNDTDEISMDALAQSLEDFMLSSAVYGDDQPVIVDSLAPQGDLTDSAVAGQELSTLLDPLSSFDSNDPYYMDPQNVLVPATDDDDDLDSDDVLYTDALESSFTDDYDEDDDDDDDDNDPFLDLDDDDDEALKDAQGVQYMESSSTPEPTTPNNQPQQPRSLSSSPLLGTQLVYPPSKQELQQQQLQQQQLQQQQQQQQQEQQTHHNQYNEKVIRLSECPICHRPNLSRRAQMDIVTHVATCAANDWTTVDRFLMGNFITEQYAQRKWFVKLVSKVGYGKYAPGKNNANIIVQDRKNGQLIEERMSVYIRLGMRLVYKGMKTGIQSKTAKRVLTNMTIRQGKRFDSPQSAREIPAFIKFHRLDMSQVLEPLDHFKTFNEFFYRKLKPGARPCESPDDPTVVVSPADCRMMAFQTIEQATKIWIKGMDFTVAKLLDDPAYAQGFDGGSLAIFRLAPQDYHRFHLPVDGIITETRHLEGQYYTVNPMAIRTTLDVYGDNARSIVRMETKEFGNVAIVCIGAMMVGSILLTAKLNTPLKRTDELGYFAFGGSTLVVIWEKGAIQMDQDLLENSEKPLESLVSVGEKIATAGKASLS